MELIRFTDNIKVERATGVKDDWGRIATETVYEGKGRYQQGGQVYTGLLVTNSVLFLAGDVFLKEDDVVFVTLHNERVKRGIVGTIRYIEMPLSGTRYTRMELKQVTDYEAQDKDGDTDDTDNGNDNPDEGDVELPED